MKNNKIYIVTLLVFCLVVSSVLWIQNDTRREKALIKEIMPQARGINLVRGIEDDIYIKENFPAVEKVYNIDGLPGAFIVSGIGYVGTIKALVVIDNQEKKTAGIRILEQGDTPFYADPIKENWFMERIKGLELIQYLNRVVLDPENPNDIVQVTGATVSSQAVINNVNSAIGAWNYLAEGVKKEPVENTISQEMWEKDENSFLIVWPENSVRVNVEDLKKYPQVRSNTILQKTTGVKIDIEASGPLLNDVLKDKGIDISDYEAIGVTGRDNYYTMLSKDILENRDVILGTVFDGEDILREEKPIRVVVPDEMGVYWVKMVNKIELYSEISPKDIDTIHIFDGLVDDLDPYYYEYFGSQDKAFLVGKILKKFDYVDSNGFFTMVGSDGLVKNETISMVLDRYYIKAEGDNAPMNIGPAFKLGMNVKEMSHFSTTKDAVIFPRIMMKVVGAETIEQGEAMKLMDVVETSGMVLEEGDGLKIINSNNEEYTMTKGDLDNTYLILQENRVDAVENTNLIKDIQRIVKIKN